MAADQVVEPEPAPGGLLQQVRVEQPVDHPAGVVQRRVGQRGSRIGVEIRLWAQGKQPMGSLPSRIEIPIGTGRGQR